MRSGSCAVSDLRRRGPQARLRARCSSARRDYTCLQQRLRSWLHRGVSSHGIVTRLKYHKEESVSAPFLEIERATPTKPSRSTDLSASNTRAWQHRLWRLQGSEPQFRISVIRPTFDATFASHRRRQNWRHASSCCRAMLSSPAGMRRAIEARVQPVYIIVDIVPPADP